MDVIQWGGLNMVLHECRKHDIQTLRHCAVTLANLSLYGGELTHEEIIKSKVPMWLSLLASHYNDSIKYYACLASAALVTHRELEAIVLQSGVLSLVESLVTNYNPCTFARSSLAYVYGHSPNWLQQLVPMLNSKYEEARNLAAFHFCAEAEIKKMKGSTKPLNDINVARSLCKIASRPNEIASKFAAKSLKIIGEEVPEKLIQQVPLWSVKDVKQWLMQVNIYTYTCLLYTSPSPRDRTRSRMPSSA